MKTFIAVIFLGLSVGAIANTSNTQTPGYSDPSIKSQSTTTTTDSMDMDQQRMEETKTKTKRNADGTIMDSTEKVRTIDSDSMDSDAAPAMDSTSTKTKKTTR